MEDYNALLLQLIDKDETIKDLQDCQQILNIKVFLVWNDYKKTNVIELICSPLTSSTFDGISCIPIVGKKYVVDACTHSRTLLATNDVISPSFEKHTIGIGSQLLSKMAYNRKGLSMGLCH